MVPVRARTERFVVTFDVVALLRATVFVLLRAETPRVAVVSLDRFPVFVSKLDNVTIVGTHTGGEGVEGYIFMYSLPNSRMCYAYTPCKSEETNGANALTGTAPDVVFYQTLEDKREIMRYYSAGINPYSYAVMMEYDDMLLNTVEYVKAYN